MKLILKCLWVLMVTGVLLGCQKPPTPEEIQPTIDPKAEAESALFMELGIDALDSLTPPEGAETFPSVITLPPELPAVDAWSK